MSITVRHPRFSLRCERRTATTAIGLTLAALTVAFVSLMVDKAFYGPLDVLATLSGNGPAGAELFIVEWRLPRVVCALTFGAILGVSGAIFQTLTPKPLGSPDIIGFTTGAYTGGLVAILLLGSGFWVIATGSLVGGLATAGLIFALSRRDGGQGFRLIIVGIVTAMLASLDTWLILTAQLDLAMVASTWGAGSLNGMSFDFAGPSVILGTLAMVATVFFERRLRQLDLGDDMASALGSAPGTTRVWALLVGVVLVALSICVTGPIAFVALAAPHIARKLSASPSTPLLVAGSSAAFLLVGADFLAQHAIPGTTFPVGLVTVSLGGLYLLALIVQENRKGTL